TLAATGHHGGLSGMEAGHGVAGHIDDQKWPHRGSGIVLVFKVAPQLRPLKLVVVHHRAVHAHSHYNHAYTNERIEPAEYIVEGGDEVVDHHDPQQEGSIQRVGGEDGQQAGRAGGEHHAAHHQQHHGEHTHDVLHAVAQVLTGELGDAGAIVAHGEHAAHIVV